MRVHMSVAAVGGLLIATAAFGQGNAAEKQYCSQLVNLYVTYVGSSEFSPQTPGTQRTDPEARLAISRCHEGDTTTAIPILESRLRNAKVNLPPRG